MATYNITKSDGNPGPAIADAASPDTQTDLQLVGQNAVSYGLDVATSFYWLLEHFANTTAPTTGSAGRATGQLWYNTTAGKKTINVYNGATWDEMAPTAQGTVNNATLRFDLASLTWTEETQVTVTSAGALSIAGATTGDVAFSHDDTDLNITGTLTTDITVDGTIVAVNIPSLTLVTVLDETYGGTGIATYAAGDVLYASGANTLAKLPIGANGEVLTLAAGVPSWASGGGVGTVTSSGTPLNNEVAVFATGTDINSDATFTWDGTTMFATNVTGTNIGGIASANLIDRAAPGTITGAAIFSNAAPINATAGDLLASNGNGLSASNGAGAIAIRHDATDVNITHSSTTNWNITGLSGSIIASSPIHTKSAGSEGLRVTGDAATWILTDSYIAFYDSGSSQYGLQIGTEAADGIASRVNSRIGDLNLYAANTLMMNMTATTAAIKNTAGDAMVFRNPFTVGTNATTSATVGDINNNQYNVGYNETPTVSIDTGSITLDALDIGKFLSRTASTSRSVTLNQDTDIPIGGSVVVYNGSSSGTVTIVPGTATLKWIDGSGTLPASATRTIANNSVVTLRKDTTTSFQIWGNGIS